MQLAKFFKKIDDILRYIPIFNIPYYILRDRFTSKNVIQFSEFYLIVGRRGRGKTLTLSKILADYYEKYGDKIYIATNYDFKFANFNISGWEDFLKDYDKPIIFAIDEIQNEFMARSWQDFPLPVFHEFTQTRKKNKMLIATAQDWSMVDKIVRTYSDHIIQVNIFFNRFVQMQYFTNMDYKVWEKGLLTGRDLQRLIYKKQWYIAHNELRDLYNTKENVNILDKYISFKDYSKILNSSEKAIN